MVLMTHNTDIADAWEREAEDPRFFYLFSPERLRGRDQHPALRDEPLTGSHDDQALTEAAKLHR